MNKLIKIKNILKNSTYISQHQKQCNTCYFCTKSKITNKNFCLLAPQDTESKYLETYVAELNHDYCGPTHKFYMQRPIDKAMPFLVLSDTDEDL